MVDPKLQVAALKAEVGELRSGGIPQFNPWVGDCVSLHLKHDVYVCMCILRQNGFKMSDTEQRYRLVVLGSGRVGKSSIIRRLLKDEFVEEYKATVEDLHCREYDIDGTTIKVDILDTAGLCLLLATNFPFGGAGGAALDLRSLVVGSILTGGRAV